MKIVMIGSKGQDNDSRYIVVEEDEILMKKRERVH